MRGRQANTCTISVKSTSRKVNTGVTQCSQLSPSLFSFYIAGMSRPTTPFKLVCYADDQTVLATGVRIPYLDAILNGYLEKMTVYRKYNFMLMSAPTSSVRLLTSAHTMPRPIRRYTSRTHSYSWSNDQIY